MAHLDTDPARHRTHPRHITVIKHIMIPLTDGNQLAARIWLPASAEEQPVPAVLEYIPYRKNDATAPRDQTIHPEFAKAGYASIRVDIRGSGDSDGVMADEYAEAELADGVEVLSWIGRQSWSNGKVAMIGKSWGGFNGLQLAALRPPELTTIITVCSTDDRYADDVHYNGGAIVGSEMLSWASTMLTYNARPADPKVVGDTWRENWFKRIDEAPSNIEDWLSHQRRDDYWKHGSVNEDFSAIQIPVFAVGGLLDEYRTTLFRLMENVDGPVHSLLGPWAHNYPHQAAPGPGIDFIAESIRWLDHWMQGVDNGVDTQPRLRAYVTESGPIGSDTHIRPGRWVSEQSWPSPQITTSSYNADSAALGGPNPLSSTETVGYFAGSWLQFGEAAGQPLDQAADDARSWTATWEPTEEPLDILGTPEVELTVRSSTDRGVIAVRLNDVSPSGESRLLTMGLFNLTHHTSHEHPVALTPGEPVTVRFPLLSTAHRFAPGHRVRMSVSASYWPMLWPTGTPDARIEVWEADDDGFYAVQYSDGRVAGRAHLYSDQHGEYNFWGLTPTPYPIPHDGPVGQMLEATGRSPVRAAHLHFMVTAPGYRTLVTHIFVQDDPQLEIGDSVFGVKDSLIKVFEKQPADAPAPDGRELDEQWSKAQFDIVLAPATSDYQLVD